MIGGLAILMGTIFVDRNAPRDTIRVMGRLEAAVAAGDGVVLFAEATSSPGSDVLPFRPALLEWAARDEHPVYYASLSYRTPEGSAPAHLAGALGRPVWNLVPFMPDWRWRGDDQRSRWYPTMRLFRQARRGDWAEVVNRVAGALADYQAQRRD